MSLSQPSRLGSAVPGSGLHDLDVVELASLVFAREVSSAEVTRAYLDRIAALDGALGAYALVTADRALAQARAADAEIAAGCYRGPLHGVPIAIKDLFQLAGTPTAAGTIVLRDAVADRDATVVRRLKAAGAVILGTLQMTEGAYSDHHPSVTPPRNPWDAAYWTGISSSGSAVATAAGLCAASLGSDTGGSIRWPCAANGLTGLKPTWGRVSRHGVVPLAPSLDHVGPIARSAVDAAALLGAIAGFDAEDLTTRFDPVPDYSAALGRDMRGLRIGVDPMWNSKGADDATSAMLSSTTETFRALGAEIAEVRFPDVTQAVADWFPNCAVEAAVAHEATYPSRKDDYGPALSAVIEAGRALSGLDYQKLLLRRADFRARVSAAFGTIDMLLTPVQPFAAPTVAQMRTFVQQPDFVAALLRFTSPFDMTGHPTLVLPGGATPAGLPLGFQLVAAHLGEATLLGAGTAFQAETAWHRRRPRLDPAPGTRLPGA